MRKVNASSVVRTTPSQHGSKSALIGRVSSLHNTRPAKITVTTTAAGIGSFVVDIGRTDDGTDADAVRQRWAEAEAVANDAWQRLALAEAELERLRRRPWWRRFFT